VGTKRGRAFRADFVAAALLLLVTGLILVGLAFAALAAIFTIYPDRTIGPLNELGTVSFIICSLAIGLVITVTAILVGGYHARISSSPRSSTA
jgi:uncharacterized membrane protein YhaH (DUF805 family)